MAIVISSKTKPKVEKKIPSKRAVKNVRPKIPSIDQDEAVMDLVCTRWIMLQGTYKEAISVVGYLRGMMAVDKALKNVAMVREYKFLIRIATGVIQYRFGDNV